ncbi:MAG TPA: hypothetical protein PK990_06470 [Salinivirgaceae bacterium]|nr:hypothetical protein [Salinivirgaceae bacterium]
MKQQFHHIIVWVGLLIYVILTAGFAAKKSVEVECAAVEIHLTDTINKLVSKNEILELLSKKKISIFGSPMSEINKWEIARQLQNNIPYISKIGVYPSYDGKLHIKMALREPMIRVFNKYGRSYYVDTDGYLMPLSANYSARVVVATGNIYESSPTQRPILIDSLYRDTTNHRKPLKDIFNIVSYINQDPMLKAQFEQIHVQGSDYILIPKVGMQTIVLGDADNIVDKFYRLKALYYKGFGNLGWQKYKSVSLKYSNQVVCIKR